MVRTFLIAAAAVALLGSTNALPRTVSVQLSIPVDGTKYGEFEIVVTKATSTSCTADVTDKNSVAASNGQQKSTCTISSSVSQSNQPVKCSSGAWFIASQPTGDGNIQNAFMNHFVEYRAGVESLFNATVPVKSQGPVYRVRASYPFSCYPLSSSAASAQFKDVKWTGPANEYGVSSSHLEQDIPFDFVDGTGLAVDSTR